MHDAVGHDLAGVRDEAEATGAPVDRSFITTQSEMSPKRSKYSRSPSVVVSRESPPTNTFPTSKGSPRRGPLAAP